MNVRIRSALRAAEKAATRLVAECRKGTPLYDWSPSAVAQVSRTGKWFLNAIAALTGAANPATARPAKVKKI